MVEHVEKIGVTLNTVHGSCLTPAGDVAIRFRASNGRLYELELAPGAVPMSIVALMQQMSKVAKTVEPIRVVSLSGGQFGDGSPMIFLGLDGCGELPLVMEDGDLSELIEMLQDIKAPTGKPN